MITLKEIEQLSEDISFERIHKLAEKDIILKKVIKVIKDDMVNPSIDYTKYIMKSIDNSLSNSKQAMGEYVLVIKEALSEILLIKKPIKEDPLKLLNTDSSIEVFIKYRM